MVKFLLTLGLLFSGLAFGDTKEKPVEEKEELAVEETTEYQDYVKALEAKDQAWLELEATTQWQDYMNPYKDSDKSWMAVMATIEFQVYKEAWQAYEIAELAMGHND